MKTGRIIAYALGGIIAGLLLENSGLRIRQKAVSKADDIKKKIRHVANAVKSKLA